MIRRTPTPFTLYADGVDHGVEFGLDSGKVWLLDDETLALDVEHPEFQILAGPLVETKKGRPTIGGTPSTQSRNS